MTMPFVIVLVVLLLVVAVLVVGVLLMAKGGEANRKYGNKLMIARVSLQGLAILLLVVLALSHTL